jgi:hypothetical protein
VSALLAGHADHRPDPEVGDAGSQRMSIGQPSGNLRAEISR